MGYSSWSDAAYRRVTADRAGASSAEIFRGQQSIDPLMNPKGLTFREARDSEHHPRSVPIIVAFDVTGSMGHIPTRFATVLLGRLMARLVEEGWVADPQVLFAGIGDAESDRAPLQVGQFESGLEMDMWLTRLWIESRGGDWPESYLLPHWFAAYHTATDAWEKRGRKGYLFTIGDAGNKPLRADHVKRVFGYAPKQPADDASVVRAAAERWHIHHLLVTRGREPQEGLVEHWESLVGKRVLRLDHEDAACDLMGVAMALGEGTLGRGAAREILIEAGLKPEVADDVLGRL